MEIKHFFQSYGFKHPGLLTLYCNAVFVLGSQTSMQSDLLRRRVGVRAAYEVLKETDRYSNISHAGLGSGHISCLSMMISTHDLNIHLGMQISTPDLKIHLSTSSQHTSLISPLDLNKCLSFQISTFDLNIFQISPLSQHHADLTWSQYNKTTVDLTT